MSARYTGFLAVLLTLGLFVGACSSPKDAPSKTPDVKASAQSAPPALPSPPVTPTPPPPAAAPEPAPMTEPAPAATPAAAPAEPAKETPETITVYVTTKGKFYHADGCKMLWRSKNPLTLKEAIAKGYKPCKVCNPPTVESLNAPKDEAAKTEGKTDAKTDGKSSAKSSTKLKASSDLKDEGADAKETKASASGKSKSDASSKTKAASTDAKRDEAKADTVYVMKGGKHFHLATCKFVGKGRISMSRTDAEAKGLTACTACNP